MSHVVAEGLTKRFAASTGLFGPKSEVQAVSDVSFEIARGSTFGLVGESGCGKSTIGRLLLGLIPPTAGRARLGEVDVTALHGEALRRLRRRMQMIFQDPYGSLNPRLRIGNAVAEPLLAHLPELTRAQRQEKVLALLTRVGLGPSHAGRFPGELSGGQRQRVVIARALIADPEFVFADEPVSALDVSIQAQILNLLADLQAERKLTFLFVSHDLRVVEHVADEVGVMYLGRIVERASKRRLYAQPLHPYTRALLSAVPDPRPGRAPRVILEGEVPSPRNPPTGCPFHPRCPLVKRLSPGESQRCSSEFPAARAVGDTRVSCHFAEKS